ncbi:hypothetical protein [Pseudomonas akapageensis]|uniref:hypothetical protein n=1 Tax=Pseudomonas akapageensis TaxID=2609961 RepID=UPI00140D3AE2|nr:hypothetical protein [Pseudomonas akapageensis]
MSRYLNRHSLIGCTFAIGLLSGMPLVQAGEVSAEHAHAAAAMDKPATKHKTKTSESKSDHGSMNHGTMDHSKMNHESMDHDSNTKKAD